MSAREQAAQASARLTAPRLHRPCGTVHAPGPCPDGAPKDVAEQAQDRPDAHDRLSRGPRKVDERRLLRQLPTPCPECAAAPGVPCAGVATELGVLAHPSRLVQP